MIRSCLLAAAMVLACAGCTPPAGAPAGSPTVTASPTASTTPPTNPTPPPSVTPPSPVALDGTLPAAGSYPAGRITFTGRTRDGRDLTWRTFRTLQNNGHGEDGENDMLLDPATLQVRTPWPLYPDANRAVLDRPAGKVALSLAWPTASGHHALIIDLPGPGRHDFHVLAARQVIAEVDAQIKARGGVRLAPTVTADLQRAKRLAANPATAATALDAAIASQQALLASTGLALACRSKAPWAVTLTNPSPAAVASAADMLAGTPGPKAVRFAFDRATRPASHAAAVTAAHARGLTVVGEILDSSEMASLDAAAWQRRVRDYVAGLPGVDVWEVGNEVNGDWLGRGVREKVLWAARYVKQHSRAKTLVTLIWDLGESERPYSTFTWLATNLPPAVARDIDEWGLSVYPEIHPLGTGLGRVLHTLRSRYPAQRLSISELGYRAADIDPVWSAGPGSTDVVRARLFGWYGRVMQGVPNSGGGPYWWYFTQDAKRATPLWRAMGAQVAETHSGCPR